MNDVTLRQDVLEELEFEPRVNAAHIGATVDKGIVTLSGYVTSYAEKQAAIDAVRHVSGVQAIADDIEVRYDSAKKTSDDEIAKRAVDILAWDSLVPKDAVSILVSDGWVTLSGNVHWYYQKKTAEDNVRKLTGVRGIINNIAIAPAVKADDVKRKIEDALKRHAEVEAKSIRITVKQNDEVLLEGTVDNWDERYAVQNAAWSAPGVKSVDDRLAIAVSTTMRNLG